MPENNQSTNGSANQNGNGKGNGMTRRKNLLFVLHAPYGISRESIDSSLSNHDVHYHNSFDPRRLIDTVQALKANQTRFDLGILPLIPDNQFSPSLLAKYGLASSSTGYEAAKHAALDLWAVDPGIGFLFYSPLSKDNFNRLNIPSKAYVPIQEHPENPERPFPLRLREALSV